VSYHHSPKHVIFLGAGASVTSGYPLAEKLRKEWLISKIDLRKKIFKMLHDFGGSTAGQVHAAQVHFDAWIEPIAASLQLFREGGFGTIDEFCYLIRHARDVDVQRMKSLLRLIFGLHSPEQNYTNSDYYGFIQRLFNPKGLSSLKSDVAVFSYNYDPYLGNPHLGGYAAKKQIPIINRRPSFWIDSGLICRDGIHSK
jgi:hypothetical protein